jgi:hypothetical protein
MTELQDVLAILSTKFWRFYDGWIDFLSAAYVWRCAILFVTEEDIEMFKEQEVDVLLINSSMFFGCLIYHWVEMQIKYPPPNMDDYLSYYSYWTNEKETPAIAG